MPSSERSVRLHGVQWWVVVAAAEALQVRADQVRRLVRQGKLRSCRIGGLLWVAKDDVERYSKERGAWRPGGVYGGIAALPESEWADGFTGEPRRRGRHAA